MSRDISTAPDPAPRRALLCTANNPEPGLDYLVTMRVPLSTGADVEVRYVPDRQVLVPESLPAYMDAVVASNPATVEAVAALILGDLLNEALPRWARVSVTPPAHGNVTQVVVMEDRRPGWDNPALLARLAPL